MGKTEKSRRANGEGTVWYDAKRKKWRARVAVRTTTGKRTTTLSADSQQDVIAAKARAVAEADDSPLAFSEPNLTFARFLSAWIKGPAKKKIRGSTHDRYAQIVRKHLVPSAVGSMRLKDVTDVDLEDLYEAKLSGGLSPTTVNYIHVTASKALGYALRKNLVRRNAAASADHPRPDSPEIHPLSREDARRFLASTRGGRLESAFDLALGSGLRRGEILGIMLPDLDADAGVVQIRRSLTIGPDNAIQIGDTKRPSSKRLIDLPAGVAASLKAHLLRRKREELATRQGTWQDSRFLFTNRQGGPLHPHNFHTAYFLPAMNASGLSFRFHDLRHTYATLALLAGVPVKVVSENLGHKDIATTLRIYAHVIPGMGKEAAKVMDSVLF